VKIPVIFYHKIGHPSQDVKLKNLFVTPENFSRHLRYLRLRNFRSLDCESYLEIREGDAGHSSRSILITFDDGFRDNYEVAFPLLKKFGFKATIFLVVGDVGKRVSWEESEEKVPEDLLTWEQIREMHEYGIDFQVHGFTHRHMDRLNEKELKRELKVAKEVLENKLQKEVRFLAYPYGTYNNLVKRIARECGYCAAFTTWKGKGKDNFEIKRIGIKYNHSLIKFIRYVEWGKKEKYK